MKIFTEFSMVHIKLFLIDWHSDKKMATDHFVMDIADKIAQAGWKLAVLD